MKIHLTLLFVLFTLLTKGQVYSGVVELDSTYSSSTLYSNALSFFAMTFKSSNDVIQMKDPVSGKIIGKGIANDRNVTITISCKDGKYKYEITIDEVKDFKLTLNTNNFGNKDSYKNAFGSISMKGKSYVDVKFINKVAFINKENTYFEFEQDPRAHYYYNGKVPGILRDNHNEWKKMIDLEFEENNNYSSLSKPQDKIVNDLIDILKNEMSKSDW
jgi:hypothetical protein